MGSRRQPSHLWCTYYCGRVYARRAVRAVAHGSHATPSASSAATLVADAPNSPTSSAAPTTYAAAILSGRR